MFFRSTNTFFHRLPINKNFIRNLLCVLFNGFCFCFCFLPLFPISQNLEIYLLNFSTKNIFHIISFYAIESFILFNLFLILSFRIKLFFKENFWILKKNQKKEIFFIKKTIILIFIFIIFNNIFFQWNLNTINIINENNDYFLIFKNSILSFSNENIFFNNFSNFFFKNILFTMYIFILFMYYTDLFENTTKFYKNIYIYFILLNFLILFSIFFINCYDFFIFFIILVGINICTYSLLIFDTFNKNAREAAIKYFMASTIGTLFILGGISLIFLFYKTTNFFLIHEILIQNQNIFFEEKLKVLNKIIFVATEIFSEAFFGGYNLEEIINFNLFIWNYNNFLIVIFLLLGLTFKLALFPLHSWSIEIYSAIKYRVISLFILILKLIFFIKTIQILFFVFQLQNHINDALKNVLVAIALSSIIYSSFAALYEDKIKKIIAYSSINQLGFVFLSFSTTLIRNYNEKNYWNFIESIQTSIFFILIYIFSNLIFLWILYSNSKAKEIVYIKDLNEIPIASLIPIVIIILSFSGLPPLAGFFSKFFVLYLCWKNDLIFIIIVVLLSSILSNYYYLKIIKVNVFDSFKKKKIINLNKPYIRTKTDKTFIFNFIIYIIAFFILFFFSIFENIMEISLLLAVNMLYLI